MRGKHRAPSTVGRNLARAGTAAVVSTMPMVGLGNVAEASNGSATPVLDVIAQCESGNKNISTHGGSTASGYFQILDSTWKAFGGTEFGQRALHATREEQVVVANRIMGGQGISAWDPSRGCWSKKVTVVPPTKIEPVKKAQPVQKHTAPNTPKPVAKKKQQPQPTRVVAQRAAQSYLIEHGDTLWRIAHAHGTTVSALVSVNRDTVKNPDRIYAGNHLRLR